MQRNGIQVAGLLLVAVALSNPSPLFAQHEWQEPPPPRLEAKIQSILGPQEQEVPPEPARVLLVWGVDENHGPGYHEYQKVRDLFGTLLSSVPRVQVDSVRGFPDASQWQWADLVVFYLHLDFLEAPQYELMDAYLDRGGGIVAIHEAVIQRPTGEPLAKRWGLAWEEGESFWGFVPTPVTMDTSHAITQDLPRELPLVDEFYWDLTGKRVDLDMLGTAPGGPEGDSDGPAEPQELDGRQWPVFWTVENSPGRVFVSLIGHNYFTFFDPYFRIVLFRGMAWAMEQPFDPFKPLVTKGVELDSASTP